VWIKYNLVFKFIFQSEIYSVDIFTKYVQLLRVCKLRQGQNIYNIIIGMLYYNDKK